MFLSSISPIIYIVLGVILFIFIVLFVTTYICYLLTFHVKTKDKTFKEEFPLPDFEDYIPFHKQILEGMKYANGLDSTDHYITSFDGLKLHAKYYKCKDSNITEIMVNSPSEIFSNMTCLL